jgi:hypothetical protein
MANSINTTITNVAIASIKYQTVITASKSPILDKILPFTTAQQNLVTVVGMISTSATTNSAEAYSQYQDMLTFLSESAIAGMTASNPTLGVNGGEVHSSDNGNNNGGLPHNIVIILAIAIPIIGISIYIII